MADGLADGVWSQKVKHPVLRYRDTSIGPCVSVCLCFFEPFWLYVQGLWAIPGFAWIWLYVMDSPSKCLYCRRDWDGLVSKGVPPICARRGWQLSLAGNVKRFQMWQLVIYLCENQEDPDISSSILQSVIYSMCFKDVSVDHSPFQAWTWCPRDHHCHGSLPNSLRSDTRTWEKDGWGTLDGNIWIHRSKLRTQGILHRRKGLLDCFE